MNDVKIPKKLIETALPLDAINAASAREKSIRHGHPSTLHLWWARRPLAAARAVLFAQMVNDPGYERNLQRGVNKEAAALERKRLFGIIERLVLWENTNNEEVLAEARAEVRKSWQETCELNKKHPQAAELFNPDKLPAFHDPFAGGGAIPLEAQRLGLEAWASDLNPVAVTINKAMIEIPPKFAGRGPVGSQDNPDGDAIPLGNSNPWPGAKGLAEDVRRYGAWMREEAQKRIGHLYPQVEIAAEMALERPDLQELVGQKLTVIAWLWARTVKSPNPAFSHVDVPLVSSFVLSSKAGKEAWVEPIVENDRYRFVVRTGAFPAAAKNGTVCRKGAVCLLSETAIDFKYLRAQAKAGHFGVRLMAIVAEGSKGRVYLDPLKIQSHIAHEISNIDISDVAISHWPGRTNVVEYGMTRFSELFTSRQLTALSTFADLVPEAIELVRRDALAAGWGDDDMGLDDGGCGATAYAQAIGVYLAFVVDKMSDSHSALTSWTAQRDTLRNTFARQALPMVWDFAEANPFSGSAGNLYSALSWVEKAISLFPTGIGHACQQDAQTQVISDNKVVSSDPPYYDNIGYADLSDFFYVWLRKSIKPIFPRLYATMAVPKAEELVATPYRHGGKDAAESFFLGGMTQALKQLAAQAHPAFPVTIYYAFKQAETKEGATSSTGWETFLAAVLDAGFAITGTWPMRTEREGRTISFGSNTLASSIVLVCRRREKDALSISRREFLRELNQVLPEALEAMTGGEGAVAPVDLSQAVIGPGMGIFSRYQAVLEADGSAMSVGTALKLINRFLSEDDFDADTQCCLGWFEQYGWSEGAYGEAEVLSKSKGTSIGGLVEAGVAESSGGRFRLLRWSEYPADWSPLSDNRVPVWEALHQLIRALYSGGEQSCGALLAQMPERGETIRSLAYRLYPLCERRGWAEDARGYNELMTSWSAIENAAAQAGLKDEQITLDWGE
ncbi:MAG: DUF1156 domain-containing protein [Negativicutes bacterium]|nr:DUF1156 domain-containing protein [Negativicutes bacterium]